MHSVGTCLLMDEVGALTTSCRCEREHCVPRAPEIRRLIWKGGKSSSQRQDAGESPPLRASRLAPLSPSAPFPMDIFTWLLPLHTVQGAVLRARWGVRK